MSLSKIIINKDVFLSELNESDEKNVVIYLNEKDIYKNTLRIPFPYHQEDFKFFFSWISKDIEKNCVWAIRNHDGKLIGVVGFHNIIRNQKAEIGYWLGKPYWGKGIMTAAVKAASAFAFESLGLSRIYACVFLKNIASTIVLEKCGFELEGILKKNVKKDGVFLDEKVYALVK
ncbi:GNAT family N-acetyltransferase [bacterium]|jgi:[ribosomal protein S5]-alanine N-acetyltransferase|nr:GNAT family N-acetyltransferase [bacterium]